MKQYIFLGIIAIAAIAATGAPQAYALSCLSVDQYLETAVGGEEVIFVGTVSDQIEGKNYTAEVITVEEVKQGYAEKEVFVYHQSDETWGYFCNAGPGKDGEKSVYITTQDSFGKYNVTQRLSLTDPLVISLDEDLKEAEITGSIGEVTKVDRSNQIMTMITDAFKQIQTLFKEYLYFKTSK